MFGWLRKAQTVTLDQLGTFTGWLGWGTASNVVINERTALDVTAVFCAARVIAEGLAQMPVRVVAMRQDAASGLPSWQERPDHWARALLMDRPNGWQTGYEFREGMIFCAALGAGALAIKNEVRGEVRELLPVPPGAWTVEHLPDWTLRIRVDYADKTHGYFTRDQVLLIRGPSLDGFTALPAVRQAREAIGLSRVLEQQQARLAGNGGKPSGVLSFSQTLSPEAAEKVRATWQQRFGRDGEGGIAVFDRETKFSPMTMTSVDAQFLETRRMQVEEIARAFRVQPIMLMQADKAATFASAEQMFRNHVIHTLGPWIERFEAALARDILRNETGLKIDLDERQLLRGDFKDMADYLVKALGAGGQPGWMTPNEARAEVGLNPLPESWANKVPRGAMNPEGDENGTQAPAA
jgi:HK97 family phage portal protein